MTLSTKRPHTRTASTTLPTGGDIIPESGGAIISETGGDFVGIGMDKHATGAVDRNEAPWADLSRLLLNLNQMLAL